MKKLLFIDYQPLSEGSARVRCTRPASRGAAKEFIRRPDRGETRLSREKGRVATEATLAEIFKQIETLRKASLPNTGAAK